MSQFEPLLVIWQSLRRPFEKTIEGLEGKINGQALGAALRLCLRGSDGRAQTQGAKELQSRRQSLRAATWDVATEAHANRRGQCGLMRFAANRIIGLFRH